MHYFTLFLAFLILSCTGYRMQRKTNPFAQYSIRSIHVPMFYNSSNFANVSTAFTQEIFSTLVGFKDIKLGLGESRSDAVLIGIIESPDKMSESIQNQAAKSVQNTFGDDVIGNNREDFKVSSINKLNLSLRIIVIKHPTENEIKFLKTQMGQSVINSKIIFNERIPISYSMNLKELSDESIRVLGTQNNGLERQALKTMAENAARSFKDMILYAF